MTTNELLHMTLVELTEALHGGKASPVELMEATLARCDETHGALNALVTRRDHEELLRDAREAEARIRKGEARPLEGVPLGVKDLEDAEGLVTSHGSLPFKDEVASHDSAQVARLKSAGAIVVGKTNAPEFGTGAITKNLVYGVTRSPWNTDHTPGGSSGGSAALMAAEAMPLVTASDGGGSVRIPASFTGCFGLKTSYGRIPQGPREFWDYDATAVHGPLTKTVEDAALFLDQAAGEDPRDPASLPRPERSYLEAVRTPLDRKLRIAYSPDLGYAVVRSDVGAAVEQGVAVFEGLGHTVKKITGGPPEMAADWGLLTAWELGSHIAHLLPERRGDFMRSWLRVVDMATGIDMAWWGKLAKKRMELVEWVARVFEDHDLLVTPTVPFDAAPAKGPFPQQTEGRDQRIGAEGSFTIPFNLSWNPAATVRVGVSAGGLPMGMQIVGPQHRDDLVLQAARAFERERPWHPTWPMRG